MKSMAERYERPDWVRRMNAMAGSVGGAQRMVPIEADELLQAAIESVGSDDFGDFEDAGWERGFHAIVDGLRESDLHVVGRLVTKQEILRALRTRLLLARRWKQQPEIASEEIREPVIVTGPARSGTSILFELLWLDPALRGPTAWEALHPVAPSGAGALDERLAWSECEQEFWADIQPEFAALHELRSDLPVECVTLTTPCFQGPHWPMALQVPGFEASLDAFFGYHRCLLQALQHGRPGEQWLLKTPAYLMTLPELFAAYPDAWVVQTHRDPAKTMPSTVSITAMVQWLRSDHVDVATLSMLINLGFGAALNGVVDLRENGEVPKRFVDVHFTELLRDPVATVRAAYEGMGREFGDAHAERITRYLAEKPRGKFGAHQYTPEDWGFDAKQLREQQAPYIEHFGVELED
jgi:hypothetical protein